MCFSFRDLQWCALQIFSLNVSFLALTLEEDIREILNKNRKLISEDDTKLKIQIRNRLRNLGKKLIVKNYHLEGLENLNQKLKNLESKIDIHEKDLR